MHGMRAAVRPPYRRLVRLTNFFVADGKEPIARRPKPLTFLTSSFVQN